ncbi:MAG: glutathione S-transferase family protein [Hyphomonadaceae bacterium]
MSDAITIYGSSESGNCHKVKWIADVTHTPYRWIETDVFKAETRTAEFLAINPAGQVPVIVLADGRVLAQSNAIMLFLAEGTPLVPSDPFARARMLEWMFWEQYSHEPYVAVRIARKHYLGQSDAELDPALLTRGHAALARLDMQLAQTPFLVGDAATLADVALVAYTRRAEKGGFDLARYKFVTPWIEKTESVLGIDASTR